MTNEELLLNFKGMMSLMLDEKFEKEFTPIKADLKILKEDVSVLKEDVSVLKADVQDLKVRVGSLEKRLTSVEDKVLKINFILEHEIRPQICLLAENYVPAAQKYAVESARIDRLSSDVDVLKIVVKQHSIKLEILN